MSIVPATVRDLTYIAANLRPEDQREIACQLSPEARTGDIAAVAAHSTEAWVATLRGQPVAAWGVAPLAWSVLSIWAFGTRHMTRAVPAMTRQIGERVDAWIEAGVTRVEARSIVGHDKAHRWMRALGAQELPCPCWGRGGEDFILFAWTAQDWKDRRNVRTGGGRVGSVVVGGAVGRSRRQAAG